MGGNCMIGNAVQRLISRRTMQVVDVRYQILDSTIRRLLALLAEIAARS